MRMTKDRYRGERARQSDTEPLSRGNVKTEEMGARRGVYTKMCQCLMIHADKVKEKRGQGDCK